MTRVLAISRFCSKYATRFSTCPIASPLASTGRPEFGRRTSNGDALAAIEAALMTRTALDADDKRGGLAATWAKVKFDRQIVAIAKVARATAINSDDANVRALAAGEEISVIGLADLPLPPQNPQIEMQLEPPAGDSMTSESFDEGDKSRP
jgi:hypothetical protein